MRLHRPKGSAPLPSVGGYARRDPHRRDASALERSRAEPLPRALRRAPRLRWANYLSLLEAVPTESIVSGRTLIVPRATIFPYRNPRDPSENAGYTNHEYVR